MTAAHRVAWILSNGQIPPDGILIHHCDNPPCCNPSHLSIGTHQDNRDDCVSKRRQASGEKQGLAKLTWKLVREMRQLHQSGMLIKDIALKYGVHKSVARKAIRAITWREDQPILFDSVREVS
jgi:hypothetical protein